jgi:hypothetical protein
VTRKRINALAALLVGCAGFSTMETSVVIGGISTVTATAGPQLQEYLKTAKTTRALGDSRMLSLSLIRLMFDVGRVGPGNPPPALLVTDGDAPESQQPVTVPWTAPVDERATQKFSDHLLDNTAKYAPERWRGPYLDGVLGADPWGSRYAANTGVFVKPDTRTIVVVSPGPNKIIETPFEMLGIKEEGDDIVSVVGNNH